MELIPSVDLAFGSSHWNSQYEIQRYTGVTEGGRIRLKNQKHERPQKITLVLDIELYQEKQLHD